MSSLKIIFRRRYSSISAFRRAVKFLLVITLIALLAPLLANELPLVVYDQHGWHFPALSTTEQQMSFDDAILRINAPISYSPGVSDFDNAGYIGPFEKQFRSDANVNLHSLAINERHWLGTTLRGCDVFSGLIHGAGISLFVGVMAAFLSGILGIFLGGFAALYRSRGFKISFIQLIVGMLFLILFVNVIFNVLASVYVKSMAVIILSMIFYKCYAFLSHYAGHRYTLSLPVDFLESQLNVLFSSFPKTLIIIAVSGFVVPSWSGLVLLLALTGWMEISRTARAEFLRIISMNYIDAAKMSGADFLKILTKHLIPNALPAIITVLVFNVALCMLTEASLSFLGIGIPSSAVTWGSLLAEGRDYYQAWWLVLFPGFMITATIYSLLTVGEGFRDSKIE